VRPDSGTARPVALGGCTVNGGSPRRATASSISRVTTLWCTRQKHAVGATRLATGLGRRPIRPQRRRNWHCSTISGQPLRTTTGYGRAIEPGSRSVSSELPTNPSRDGNSLLKGKRPELIELIADTLHSVKAYDLPAECER